MTLAILVYLLSVIPTIGGVAFVSLGLTVVVFGLMGLNAAINLDIYSRYSAEEPMLVKSKATLQTLKRKLWIPCALTLLVIIIPSQKTLYTMVAAYAGQKVAETPEAKQLGNDAYDVLKGILVKAKKELADKDEENKK